jgi:hypothetical protein
MKSIWMAASVALLPGPLAWAWGPEGHSIVAEMAQRHISKDAGVG